MIIDDVYVDVSFLFLFVPLVSIFIVAIPRFVGGDDVDGRWYRLRLALLDQYLVIIYS